MKSKVSWNSLRMTTRDSTLLTPLDIAPLQHLKSVQAQRTVFNSVLGLDTTHDFRYFAVQDARLFVVGCCPKTQLSGHHTVLTIAHRLGTIIDYDKRLGMAPKPGTERCFVPPKAPKSVS